MWRGHILLLLMSLLVAQHLTTAAQSEGDVRLAGGPSTNFGRLEIFWQGKWSTFCGLSTGGAQAACRQLGFLDFLSYMPLLNVDKKDANISEASPGTPIAIDHTNCERSLSDGLLHILRCGYNTTVSKDCYHRNDMVLICQNTSLWTHAYESQVRLNSTFSPSSGTLEIFIEKKWGNICSNNFTWLSADSACRQMGYTNASRFSGTFQATADTVWLDNVSCKGKHRSCSCLLGCFGDAPTMPISSCPGKKYVQLMCMYDVAVQNEAPSGSRSVCTNKQTTCARSL